MSDSPNPYEAPQHYQPLPAEEPLASRGRRLLGALIDGLALALIMMALMFATGVFDRILAGQGQLGLQQTLIWALVGEGLFLAIQGWLLFQRQQTLGKWLLDMKIVGVTAEAVPFGRLYGLRYLVFHVIGQLPFIGVLVIIDPLLIFRRDRRCAHDLLAGTKVIDQRAEALVS